MKKFVSMLVVAVMLCSLSLTAFAAPTATFESKEVEAGTTSVTVNLALNFAEETHVDSMSIKFVATGATITAVDTTAIDAVITKAAGMTDAATFYYTWMDESMTVTDFPFAAGSYVIPVTVTLDSTEVGATATVGTDANSTMIFEAGTGNIFDVVFPEATITVKAAGPVIAAETVENAVTVDTNNIVVEGQEYSNVAVFNGAISFPTLEDGESLTDGGIKYNGTKVFTFPSITGGGSATYKVLFYGITADQAAELGAKIKTFYTGNFIQD